MNNIVKTFLSLVTVLLLTTSVTFANGEKNKGNKENTNSIEVKHIGNYENQPIFQLSLTASETEEFTITLRDSDGNVLYSDKVKGTSIRKKFLLTTQEIGDNIVTIEIKARKSAKAEVYTINRKQNLIEEMYVTKLK